MGKQLDKYLTKVRQDAFKAAAEKSTTRIAANRRREKLLAAEGIKKPFQDLVWEDVQRNKANGDHDLLVSTPEYVARFRQLESEMDGVEQDCKEAEDRATESAMLNPPPLIAAEIRHEKEREIFLSQNNISDLKKISAQANVSYNAMLDRQGQEIKNAVAEQ